MKQETMKSVKKTLDILKLFQNQKQEMSLSEISKLSGVSISTASRILAVLVEYKYLKHPEKKAKYSLGSIYLSVSHLINTRSEARSFALPHLTKLSQQVGEPAVLVFENGINELISEQISDPSSPQKLLTISPSNGTRTLPLNCTSVGKIILAGLSEKDLQRYFDTIKLEKYTPKSVNDQDEIRKQLIKIRKTGIAFDDDEFEIGVRGVASGIYNFEGKQIGAIGITAPAVRLTLSKLKEITPLVKNCASEVSLALGFQI
jgi:IclR family transcriptional regulator, KDG regulon repressor